MRKFLISAALVVAAVVPAAAQVTINSGAPTDGITPLGKDSDNPGIPTAVAQSFTAPTGFNYLQTFTFYLSSAFGGGSNLLLKASVFQFATDHLVGSALFASDFFLGSNAGAPVSFTIGSSEHPLNLFLAPGPTYALVLSSVEGYATSPDHSTVTFGDVADAYPGGSLFYSVATDASQLGVAGAFSDAGGVDAAGSTTFTADRVVGTPEPSTIVMLASGLVPLGALIRRRRRAA